MVHLVREVGSQKCFAAKFIKTRRRSYRELAHQEISILQGLSHENIIQYVDSYSDPASIVIVMEYLDGGELFVKIADEDFILTETDCVMFVSQICLGVQYLHSLSIVHLDLKVSNCVVCKQGRYMFMFDISFQPENIICSERNQIKIIDFGTAKRLTPEKQVNKIIISNNFHICLSGAGDVRDCGVPGPGDCQLRRHHRGQ